MADDLQRLIESLRGPGTESELANEAAAVDRVAATMRSAGRTSPPRFGRKARVATFVAAGVIGFGGVAAAGPAVLDQIDDTPETVDTEVNTTAATAEPTTTDDTTTDDTMPDAEDPTEDDTTPDVIPENTIPDESEATSTSTSLADDPNDDEGLDQDTEVLVDEATSENDPDTAFNEEKCVEGGNHGETVSSVARGDDRTPQDVVDAAQSSCGKNPGADDSDVDDEQEDADEAEPDDDADGDADEQVEADGNTNPAPANPDNDNSSNASNGNGGNNSNASNGNGGNNSNASNGNGGNNGNGRGGK